MPPKSALKKSTSKKAKAEVEDLDVSPPSPVEKPGRKAGKKASRKDAAAESVQSRADEIQTAVRAAFSKAHQSTASHSAQKSALLDLMKEERVLTSNAICEVVKEVLPMPITSEATARHTAFLGDLCKAALVTFKSDELANSVVKKIVGFINAADKNIRLAVVSLLNAMLRAFSTEEPSPERATLYDAIVVQLKYRVHDKWSAVREKAVSAISMFQQPSEDDDVTQHLLAVLCEDTSSAVRRAALSGLHSKDIFIPHVIRMTADVVATVRAAAWERLGNYKMHRLVPACRLKQIDLLKVIGAGLSDVSVAARIACETTVNSCWLRRDYGGSCYDMLGRIDLSSSDAMAEQLARVIFLAHRKAFKSNAVKKEEDVDEPDGAANAKSSAYFPLQLDGLTPSNVLLWRISCQVAMEDNAEEEGIILPTLSDFTMIFTDVVMVFCSAEPEKYVPRAARLKNVDHAEHVLRYLLSMFEIYNEGGYLNHADDTVRDGLEKILSKLLRVVPENDPSCYVAGVILALKSITKRDPSKLTAAVNAALTKLFAGLQLPRVFHLGFDDIEMFGRRDTELRQELFRLKAIKNRNPQEQERHQKLEDLYAVDTTFLLRMERIVHCYLSECQRGEPLPGFCSHMIALGRAQGDAEVRGLATYSVGVMCLMAPETVHTFMPLLIKDITDCIEGRNGIKSIVGEAAIGCVIDLINEYSFKFFANGRPEDNVVQHHRPGANAPQTQVDEEAYGEDGRPVLTAGDLMNGDASPNVPPAAVRVDDEAKVGAHYLFNLIFKCLRAENQPIIARTAALGLCKLLACNRVSLPDVPNVIAQILLFAETSDAALEGDRNARNHSFGSTVAASSFIKHIDFFFNSYAYSHPKRQAFVCEGALLAARTCIIQHRAMTPSSECGRLLKRLIELTDAAFLQQIREVDPDFAVAVSRADQSAAAADNDDTVSNASTVKSKAATNRSRQLGSARLFRELARCSLHEHVAMELLVDLGNIDNVATQKQILDSLGKLHFYRRDAITVEQLQAHVDAAKATVGRIFAERLTDFVTAAVDQIAQASGGNLEASNMSAYTSTVFDETIMENDPTVRKSTSNLDYGSREERRKKLLTTFFETNAVRESSTPIEELLQRRSGRKSGRSSGGDPKPARNSGSNSRSKSRSESKVGDEDDAAFEEGDMEDDDESEASDSPPAEKRRRRK